MTPRVFEEEPSWRVKRHWRSSADISTNPELSRPRGRIEPSTQNPEPCTSARLHLGSLAKRNRVDSGSGVGGPLQPRLDRRQHVLAILAMRWRRTVLQHVLVEARRLL